MDLNQSELLDLFKEPNAIYTSADLTTVFKVNRDAIQRHLKNLAKWGYIEKVERMGTLAPIYMRLK